MYCKVYLIPRGQGTLKIFCLGLEAQTRDMSKHSLQLIRFPLFVRHAFSWPRSQAELKFINVETLDN